MGKKKKNIKNIKKFYAIIICIITGLIAWKTPALEVIDQTIANTGLAEIVDTSSTSNVTGIEIVREDPEIKENVASAIKIDEEKLNILFFDVGQADSQLIICNGKTMLIDSGNSKDGEFIVNGLRGLNIEKIDYLIGTHIHEDHIGSMYQIVNNFEIGNIYLPYNTTTTSTYYKKLLTSIASKNLSIEEVKMGDKISVGTATCQVMNVDNQEPENQNLASIVIQMEYGEMKYLFMGDAEKENEESREWEDIDVLKVGHHGSNTSSSEKFVEQVLPEIAIISVGEGNSYGLPKDKVLNRFEKIKTKIYRTDIDGTIQLVSDGKENIITKIYISFDGN